MRPKILFILHLPPPVHGAGIVGQYIHQSQLINDYFDCDYINLSTSQKIEDIGKSGRKKTLSFLKLYIKLLIALSKKRYHICYITLNSHGTGFFKEFIIVVILRILRKRIVYHFHNKGVSQKNNELIYHCLYPIAFKNARIILLSKLLRNDIEHYFTDKNIFYCANGVPSIPKIDLKILNKARKSNKIPEILFLSNMMTEKGVYILLEAGRILKGKDIPFKMTFIGAWADISEKVFKNYIVQNELENEISYVGPKYDSEKDAYFKNANIFVFPSLNECFPLVLLEALQYGLPVISTQEGAIPEIIEEGYNGYIIPKKNAQTLADKIELLIENPSISLEMGINGRKRFLERYTLDSFERNFVRTINMVLDNFRSN